MIPPLHYYRGSLNSLASLYSRGKGGIASKFNQKYMASEQWSATYEHIMWLGGLTGSYHKDTHHILWHPLCVPSRRSLPLLQRQPLITNQSHRFLSHFCTQWLSWCRRRVWFLDKILFLFKSDRRIEKQCIVVLGRSRGHREVDQIKCNHNVWDCKEFWVWAILIE